MSKMEVFQATIKQRGLPPHPGWAGAEVHDMPMLERALAWSEGVTSRGAVTVVLEAAEGTAALRELELWNGVSAVRFGVRTVSTGENAWRARQTMN